MPPGLAGACARSPGLAECETRFQPRTEVEDAQKAFEAKCCELKIELARDCALPPGTDSSSSSRPFARDAGGRTAGQRTPCK